jgi:hypothetical protein
MIKKWVNSCLRKITYKTEDSAIEAMQRNHKKYKVRFNYYYCMACSNYHLTTKKEQQ